MKVGERTRIWRNMATRFNVRLLPNAKSLIKGNGRRIAWCRWLCHCAQDMARWRQRENIIFVAKRKSESVKLQYRCCPLDLLPFRPSSAMAACILSPTSFIGGQWYDELMDVIFLHPRRTSAVRQIKRTWHLLSVSDGNDAGDTATEGRWSSIVIVRTFELEMGIALCWRCRTWWRH